MNWQKHENENCVCSLWVMHPIHWGQSIVYVDAVQYTPHGLLDIQKQDCDFLISSAYKFLAIHSGILYGKHDLLENLFAYKVRPASNEIPGKFETGTQNHEGSAGALGAIEYFKWVEKCLALNMRMYRIIIKAGD